MPIYRTSWGESVFLTPEEWVSCDSPIRMVVDLVPFDDPRRARLTVLGCLARHRASLPEECRDVVSVGERYAEGKATPDELVRATGTASAWEGKCSADLQRFEDARQGRLPGVVPHTFEDQRLERTRLSGRLDVARYLRYPFGVRFTLDDVLRPLLSLPPGDACDLLRCVYRHVGTEGFDLSWRTTAAVGLARTMYESRDFAVMPILADALEEAGCDRPDVLAHCRADAPHVRGCWVVDLVLGKS